MSKEIQLKTGNDNVYPHPFWPIGSIYISVTNTNPSTYFGGTWQRFGQGKCIVGVNESEAEFSTVQKTGGNKSTSHIHSTAAHTLTIDEIPSHNHQIARSMNGQSGTNRWTPVAASGYETTGTLSTGGGQPHSHGNTGSSSVNVLQPYITVYMWRRTA